MTNLIIIAVLLLLIGSAGVYIVKAKKRGERCVGCPHAKACGGKCGSGCH